MTSGVMVPTQHCRYWGPSSGGREISDTVPMLPTDRQLSMRLLIDTVMMECYFMGGRVAMTLPLTGWEVPGTENWRTTSTNWSLSLSIAAAAAATCTSTGTVGGVTVVNASSWNISSALVSKEQVLATAQAPPLK
eukprot:COSAG05_NODE_312_length_11626_cov_9.515485_1_plen_135_part_00